MPYFLACPSTTTSSYDLACVLNFDTFFSNVPEASVSLQICISPYPRLKTEQGVVSFFDPSSHSQNPGWPLRSLLAYFRLRHPTSSRKLLILSLRDAEVPSVGKSWRSRVKMVSIRVCWSPARDEPCGRWVGEECPRQTGTMTSRPGRHVIYPRLSPREREGSMSVDFEELRLKKRAS